MENVEQIRDAALKALEGHDFGKVSRLAEQLKSADTREEKAEAHWLEGVVHEFATGDLVQAASCYRLAAYLLPHPRTLLALSRAIIKCQDEQYDSALKFIGQAADLDAPGYSVEILLTMGRFYEHKIPADSRAAREYYLQAAVKGNFAGFKGFERQMYRGGRYWAVMLSWTLRTLLWPVLALLQSNRTTRGL